MLSEKIDRIEPETAAKVLAEILKASVLPAFGALPKREADLMIFRALRNAGVIARDASLYELMTELRITRAKARNLLYDLEIREGQEAGRDLGGAMRTVLLDSSYFKDGAYLVVDVENPLVQAHLREKARALGFITDTSFTASIVKLPISALSALIIDTLSSSEQARVRKALVASGVVKDTSVQGVLTGALSHLAAKLAGAAAGEAAKQLTSAAGTSLKDFVGPIFGAEEDAIEDVWSGIA